MQTRADSKLGVLLLALYAIITRLSVTGFGLRPRSISLPARRQASGMLMATTSTPLQELFDVFPFSKKNNLKNKETTKLLEICESSDDVATKRKRVEAILEDLTAASPISPTSPSNKLIKQWNVIWTTEKEINLFLDRGWATDIYQEINRNKLIVNSIPFVHQRGSLTVKGTIAPSVGCRTEFEFTEATLMLANPFNAEQTVQLKLPPVGKGWFDTLYLDDTLRVDINSRNDILVCRSD